MSVPDREGTTHQLKPGQRRWLEQQKRTWQHPQGRRRRCLATADVDGQRIRPDVVPVDWWLFERDVEARRWFSPDPHKMFSLR
nr:hypothetical protein CFP56_74696 [Quercus suber]